MLEYVDQTWAFSSWRSLGLLWSYLHVMRGGIVIFVQAAAVMQSLYRTVLVKSELSYKAKLSSLVTIGWGVQPTGRDSKPNCFSSTLRGAIWGDLGIWLGWPLSPPWEEASRLGPGPLERVLFIYLFTPFWSVSHLVCSHNRGFQICYWNLLYWTSWNNL